MSEPKIVGMQLKAWGSQMIQMEALGKDLKSWFADSEYTAADISEETDNLSSAELTALAQLITQFSTWLDGEYEAGKTRRSLFNAVRPPSQRFTQL